MVDINDSDIEELPEAKRRPVVQQAPVQPRIQLQPKFYGCPLFKESYKDIVGIEPAADTDPEEFKSRRIKNALVGKKLAQFMTNKREELRNKANKSDKGSPSGTLYKNALPKIRHSHLTYDISVWYEIDEAPNPPVIKLYGVFTHDSTGTNTTPNQNRQQTMTNKFLNQADKFEPL